MFKTVSIEIWNTETGTRYETLPITVTSEMSAIDKFRKFGDSLLTIEKDMDHLFCETTDGCLLLPRDFLKHSVFRLIMK